MRKSARPRRRRAASYLSYNGARMALTSGTRLGPYEIETPLGAGGMGEVYRARDTRLDRTVAIKILPSHLSDNPEAKQRFEREARVISSLNHPHICVLHDVGSQDGTAYLVMEYVPGESLDARLQKGPLPLTGAKLLDFGLAKPATLLGIRASSQPGPLTPSTPTMN